MTTVAVTGGAGFLGSHLIDRLFHDGCVIYALDDFRTGKRENFNSAHGRRLHVIQCDITKPLPDGLPRFDLIYNLACAASPPRYQADAVGTLMASSLGVKNMLDRALVDGARLFHASTSEVYGDPDVHPQNEDYHGNVNPLGPRACYNVGKRFAETLITDYAKQYGVEVRFARIFNTYGPRMQADDGRVVSNFVVQALRGDPITLYGDGSQTRSFCYVTDMIDGFIRLMASTESGPVNLGNPAEITVKELAELVVKMTGSRSEIAYLPLPADDPRRRRPDITRALELLGWRPSVDLADGLKATVAYFSPA